MKIVILTVIIVLIICLSGVLNALNLSIVLLLIIILKGSLFAKVALTLIVSLVTTADKLFGSLICTAPMEGAIVVVANHIMLPETGPQANLVSPLPRMEKLAPRENLAWNLKPIAAPSITL